MSREIKFRAWDKTKNKFIDYNVLCFAKEGFGYAKPLGYSNMSNPDNLEIMQYTGLKDKNGKEIYEGDILLHDDDNWGYGGEYDKKHDGYTRTLIPNIEELLKGFPDYFTDQIQSWEVIGNIYETPEFYNQIDNPTNS